MFQPFVGVDWGLSALGHACLSWLWRAQCAVALSLRNPFSARREAGMR